MLKRILVPLDGSPRAERAIPVAAHLASRQDGTVILIRVLSNHNPFDPSVPVPALWAHSDSNTRASAYLAHASTHVALDGVRTEVGVYTGPQARTILAVARAHNADMIVVCGQGGSGAGRWGLDETVRQVISDAPMPVLAVPEQGTLSGRLGEARLRPLRALVALDGSALAESVLAPAVRVVAALADPGLGALHLMHVARDETAWEDARSYLSAVAHELRRGALAEHLVLLTWSVASGADAAATVIAQANQPRATLGVDTSIRALYSATFDGEIEAESFDGADLIVLSTHGYEGLYLPGIGPVAQSVLRLATCPVLTMRPRAHVDDLSWQRDPLYEQAAGIPAH